MLLGKISLRKITGFSIQFSFGKSLELTIDLNSILIHFRIQLRGGIIR